MDEFGWLFWILILALLGESWVRAWAQSYRAGQPGPADREPSSADSPM